MTRGFLCGAVQPWPCMAIPRHGQIAEQVEKVWRTMTDYDGMMYEWLRVGGFMACASVQEFILVFGKGNHHDNVSSNILDLGQCSKCSCSETNWTHIWLSYDNISTECNHHDPFHEGKKRGVHTVEYLKYDWCTAHRSRQIPTKMLPVHCTCSAEQQPAHPYIRLLSLCDVALCFGPGCFLPGTAWKCYVSTTLWGQSFLLRDLCFQTCFSSSLLGQVSPLRPIILGWKLPAVIVV